MKKVYNLLVVSFLTLIIVVSCKKDTDTTPQTCYLSTIANQKGNVLGTMTYDGNNRLVSYKSDSSNVSYNFIYNTQNLVEKVNLAYKIGTKVYTFVATFTYDGTGKATKAVTTLSDKPYQTSVFAYNANAQLSNITTTYSQGETDALRFEYLGNNIAKVFEKLDKDPEYLYYEITKFDDKQNIYPEAFRAIALGFSGLVDDFSYLTKNNSLSEKFYEEDKYVFYTENHTFEYNSTSQPIKRTSDIDDDGDKYTSVLSFQYNCK
ncbi:hypothetical protein VB796_13330 [Arcicella sp. LKC2W]|uniref:hypothetical protein n=1 Tax=Arcicella sp. LKC2W TaxID=2984198 RepID=UPI002B210209|nr:hypothetical protein [Arcicella sp. LKC2W]MEA5460032.1 hypothetical protein [Arcicella sp. LKC2W]